MSISPSALHILNAIYDMYSDIHLGSSDACNACANLPFWKEGEGTARIGPVPIYHVGNTYAEAKKKIVFVASVGYGWYKEESDKTHLPEQCMEYDKLSLSGRKTLIHKMREAQEYQLEENKISIYKALNAVRTLYGNELHFDNIALLNLFHCNDGGTPNRYPADAKGYCCHQKQGNYPFERTLKILNPDIFIGMCNKQDEWILKQEFIRENYIGELFGHPSRKPISPYAQDIVDYIKTQ